MNCKQCNAALDDGITVCPVCGCVQTEETNAVENKAAEQRIGDEISETAQNTQPPKVISKTAKRIIAVVCAVVLLLSAAAGIWYGVNGGWTPRENNIQYKSVYSAEDAKARKAADKVVATAGGKELTNSQLQIFYWMEVYSFLDNYGYYLSSFGLDTTKPLSEQIVQGSEITWEQYFLEAALSNWHNCQSLMLMAEVEGFQSSEQLRTQLENVRISMGENCVGLGFDTASEMIQADMGAAADLDAYMHYMALYYGGAEYVQHIYDQLGFTKEQVEQYYAEFSDTIKQNYGVDKNTGKLIDVRHILFCPEGGTKNEDGSVSYTLEEWDACLAKAQKALQEWKEGEATAVSFGDLANKYSEDPGSNTTGGLYTYVYRGEMVPAFNDWCFDESRKPGDVDIIQTSYGFHVMYYVEGDEGWIRYTEQQMLTDACSEIMQNSMDRNPIEVYYKNIVLGQVDISG